MASPPKEYAELRRLVTTQPIPEAGRSAASLFETRITAISRLAMAANLDSLITILRNAQPQHLQRAVVEAKTIHETSFFRDAKPFEALRTRVFPRLIAKRRQERRLRIWCAACSTGQEAYSIALLLVSNFPELADWDIKIIGTDVSEDAIAQAASGKYRRGEIERALSGELRKLYFRWDADSFRVSPDVRRLCNFLVADLTETLPALPEFDLILLRNVLLYFSTDQQASLFQAVHRQLWSRGFLMLGDAEQAEDSTHLFALETEPDAYFYRPVASVEQAQRPLPL